MDPLEPDNLADLSGVRILVVDDDRDTRELLADMLGGQGAEVMDAETDGAALALVSSWHPDVVVSDIGFDEKGYALILRLRQLPAEAGGRIGAIALTGYTSREDAHRMLAAGYDAHVPKPVDFVRLTEAIAKVVGFRAVP